MEIDRHIAYLESEIAVGRALTGGCGLVGVTALAFLRFPDADIGVVGRWLGCAATVLAGYGMICGGVFGGRLRGVVRLLRRMHLQDEIGKGPDIEVRDPITRSLNSDFFARGSSLMDGALSFFLGIYPRLSVTSPLTVTRLAREIEGAETRALASLMLGTISLALCVLDGLVREA